MSFFLWKWFYSPNERINIELIRSNCAGAYSVLLLQVPNEEEGWLDDTPSYNTISDEAAASVDVCKVSGA
jgi:hypothetical protein